MPGKSVYALEIQLFPELERQDRAGNPGPRLRARGDSARIESRAGGLEPLSSRAGEWGQGAGHSRVTGAVEIRKRQTSKAGQSGPFWPAWRSGELERPAGGVESPGPGPVSG